ncbi:MAG: LysR substrate-binding domain-containing protein, partial [Pseudomonadota bacterium]
DHPWAKTGRPVPVKALAGVPFIIREEGSGTRSVMLAALESHGLKLQDLNLAAEMGSTEAVRQAVKAGLGVSIISRVAVEDALGAGQVKIVAVKA